MMERKARTLPQGSDAASCDPSREAAGSPWKQPWLRPRLIDHGDVRELTLGLSVGNIESGTPGTFRP